MQSLTDLGYTLYEEGNSYVIAGKRGGRYRLVQNKVDPHLFGVINLVCFGKNNRLKGGYEWVMMKDGTFYAFA